MVKVQRLFAKTNLKFQFAVLVPSRVWGRHAPTRSRPKGARMGTADDFLDRYAALPSAERSSAGVRPPSASLHLSVLYRPIQPPSSSMKRAGVQSDQSLPCQNSFLSRPKKPSIAALSELQPLADWIGYTDVDSSGRGARDGRPCTRSCARAAGRGCLGTCLSTRSTSLMTGSYSI